MKSVDEVGMIEIEPLTEEQQARLDAAWDVLRRAQDNLRRALWSGNRCWSELDKEHAQ